MFNIYFDTSQQLNIDLTETLVERLTRRAAERPERIAYRFLTDGEEEGSSLTYAELDRRARALGFFLRDMGAGGERVLLLYPPGLDFVTGFLGCLYAGAVAVPAYPPRANRPDARLQAIAADARPRFALSTPALRDRAAAFAVHNPALAGVHWAAGEEIDPGLSTLWQAPAELGPEHPAFLQYTSGSTATPKGVIVRHGNLMHNERMIQAAFGTSESSVIVGWLPLYHDMGLIGNVLQPLYAGASCVLMSPVAFLQQPVRWLRAIHRYRATTSGGPNFAYELCARKIGPEERLGLDLSSWEVAYNGAEPVRAETLERFAEVFTPCGFRRTAFYPCYGLAEATLFVSGNERGAFPRVHEVDAGALERNRAEPPHPDAPLRELVSCGRTGADQRVVIAEVTEEGAGRLCPEGVVGEVWIAGPSVAGGYWGRPEETARTFGAHLLGDDEQVPYLRTGDLGFVQDGDLFLTGRAKDLIILRGRNLYPQDVELTAERSHPAMRPGCGAAFSVDVDGEERLVVVQEVERDAEKRWAREPQGLAVAIESVRRAVAEEHEAAVHAVVLVRTATIPKTSSGKIRRQACRADFLTGGLEPVGEWQEGGGSTGAAEEEVAAPRTPTEERLERIWAEVFGLPRVGIDRDLFELGGDSLRATQLLSRIRESFGADLTFDALFAAPTIAGLAEVLEAAELPAAAAPPLRHIPRDGELPLSFAQRRLWFLHQLDPENPVHNIAAAVQVEGRIAAAVLARVLTEIVRRHEALRTGFAASAGEPVQVIHPPAPLPLPVVDLAALGEAERACEARRLRAEVARLPFDLERGPFLRSVLVRQGPDEDTESELLLALHHIAADGWSLGVLLREMAALYEAYLADASSPLLELPVQVADFAAWQRGWLHGPVLEAELAFWRQRLGGDLHVVELPADRPRPAVLSHRGAHLERAVPPAVTERLEALAREGGATLFMALLAGFQALLHRYTGLSDLVVGTPIAGRNRVELEGLIGVFINNLVLRTDVGGEPAFRTLLGRTRETAVEAYAHQDLPFELLVDELHPQRDLSRTPLFQVLFVGQNAPLRRLELPGAVLTPREIDPGTARFDLSLAMGEADGGWLGTWKYSTDLFDAPTMARMASHFETLLAGAAADPDRAVTGLPLLSAAERYQVVTAWNDTGTAYGEDVCLHELIAAQAERTPAAVALEFGEEQLTYRELLDRARQLADHLRRLGVGPEVRVGIAAERSTELVVGLLGILEAGGAYVPLDPGYPADRLAYMLEDSGIRVLLTQGHLREALPPLPAGLDEGRVVLLDRSERHPAGSLGDPKDLGGCQPSAHPDPSARPSPQDDNRTDHPAYAIYTSGSTGRPKGALIPHRGIVNRLLWMQETYGLTAADRVLQKTPFSFDVSVWEFFWPLITGARLVVAPPGAHQDAALLAQLIERHGITTLHFVPSMLQIFLDQALDQRDELAEACRSVRQVFASGEALPFELQERFFDRLPGAALHNLYGPTEASVDVTFHACERDGRRRTVPIGRPVANTSIVLLDRHLDPVPAGVPGELHIGGVQLARGYLGRPELTAERFVPDPLSDRPGGRLYKTGDLARFRPDGAVEYLGRLDHQVKIRGVRIELGEIEATLCRHPAVREAVVLARRSSAGPLQLVAYAVPAAGAAPAPGELRAFLQQELSDAMVPAALVVLPAFPLTPSGKVDRKALPAPVSEQQERTFEEPATRLEERLAAMWRELLGVDRVGRRESFFELGGDSIQGAMFVNRLQKELGQIVYVMTLFDAPTIAQFAESLEHSYPEAVGRLGGAARERSRQRTAASTEEGLAELRAAVARRLGRPAGLASGQTSVFVDRERLPQAVFLLSPFRSGSTLLRVMLAGHPGLFAPPELELLAFSSMGERQRVYGGRNSFALEGLLRAVMELHGCDAERAREIVGAAEADDLPVGRFYGLLEEWSEGRLVVDKTPSYALDLATLRRAESLFEKPLYLYLARHPRATIDSYLEARMDRAYDFPFPAEEQAELVWLLAHRNIREHLAAVPAERQHALRFEDLVKAPRETMEAVCRFLGLPFEPAMLDPYEGRRMTDGLHAASRMMGDPKFHQHRGIDASVADRWRSAQGELLPEVLELAQSLGYTTEAAALAEAAEETALALRPVSRDREMPLSFAQERLWFLAQLDPESPAYNMPAAVHLEGRLDVGRLAASFAAVRRRHEVLRTTFPAAGGSAAQVVAPASAVAPFLPVIDLAGLPEEARAAERLRLALEEGRRPFDLVRGPMLRSAVVRLRGEEHVLLVTMHHIVSDGWTIGILIRELAALYRGERLAPLPLQYADYAYWQRRWLGEAAMEEHLAYWRRRLAGRLPALELPTDRPRPALQTSRGARLSRTVPAAAAEEIRTWSQREGGTLFLTLLAGFNALLHRTTGQEDLLLGIPIANRNRVEVEDLIGFFLNMVVQRTDLSGVPAFRELLARVRDGFLGSIPHQEVPFERLVTALQPERDLSRSPIFQVQFSLQNTPAEALELPGLTLELLENHNRTTKFDFTVFLFDLPAGLTTTLEYNADLFDESTIARLLGHWETLLVGAVTTPSLRLPELPLLTDEETAQLLSEWNETEKGFADEPALHRLFEEQAARRPDAVAAVCDLDEITYRRLNEKANRLARHLRSLGVGPEMPVGLCVERSLDMLVGILGILKAGGAYVPLDPSYPPERLAWILENALAGSAAPVLVTQEKLAGRSQGAGAFRIVRLDADRASLLAHSPENLDVPVTPANLAYVIYTSGSTGRPKGVPVPHGNAVRLFTATDGWFGFSSEDVWTMFHSYAFDFSVWEIWGALLYGGRLVVVPREVAIAPAAFLELLATEKVTVLSQTPSAFRQLIRADEEEGGGRLALRLVVFGGEALDLAALAPWLARRGDERPALINMYGITETTVHVTYRRVLAADLERSGVSPVGVPIPDLQVHLLGMHGELLPVGIPGEIHVGGAGLARGYLGRPDLTAERFVPDPFSGMAGTRLYRSGDLARRRPDGDLEYLGRIDGQVKIRGFRIEVGEIESALARHSAVREAVVMARPDAHGDRRLVAYVVPKGMHPDAGDLRDHVRRSLPEYMVPAFFVALDRLPLTGNGKVDRKALPEPEAALAALSAGTQKERTAPRNRTEAKLAEIWREVLRLEEVGVEDNFFEVGGHSLLVAQLSSRVRAAFGVELPLRLVFEAPTLAALAERLGVIAPEGAEEEAAPIPRIERGGPLPLSFAQERLWFLDRLNPGSSTYNIWVALRLTGPLDVPVLAAVLREIGRRHETLRTTFVQVEGEPRQVIGPDFAVTIPVVDLRGLDEQAREAEALRWLRAASLRPFDLEHGPLLRALLVRVAEADWRALFDMHHIVSDGWSNDVLVHEVGTLYAAFVEGRPSPLAPLPIQYADFAAWQRAQLSGDGLASRMGYWRERLAGAPPLLDLPADRPRPAVQKYRGRDLRVTFGEALVRGLGDLAKGEGATFFMGLLAGFETLLHRYTGRTDILVGTPVAGRSRLEVEGLIGLFINSLVLRTDLGGDPMPPTFRELLGRTRETTLGAFANQEIPFEKLVEELAPERNLSHAPIFQVMLVLQNPAGGNLSLSGLELANIPLEGSSAKLDLTLNAQEVDGRLTGRWLYNRDLFDEGTIARLSGHLERLLTAAVANPDTRISELALLTPSEEEQLRGWNATAAGYPTETCLHELIAAQVERTPDRPAVTFEGKTLTYRELDAAANGLAHRLTDLGVGPDVPVGVFAERSLEMVVALLGILKAGGAYLPLDPGYPMDRLAYMVEDSGIKALLTQSHLRGALPALPAGLGAERVVVLDEGPHPQPLSHLPSARPRERGELWQNSTGHEGFIPNPSPLPAGVWAGDGRGAGGEGLAYVIYTSGSTGRPKGTMNSHRGIVNRLLWMQEQYGLTADDRVLQKTPFSFDVSVWEFFWPLLTGARLVMARPGGHQDPSYLVETIAAEEITTLHFVPSMLQVFLEAPGVERCVALRRMICSGEALPLDLARRFRERFRSNPGAGLHNLYGPTEAAVDVTFWACDGEAGRSSVPIGRPVANTQIWILDRSLAPVPVGVPGELHIGGVQLARGYLARPELTAEKFIPDPFVWTEGARLYRTGDLARRLQDGAVDFLGRIDHQVKVRGLRIELGEIEAALAAHEAVREAVVLARAGGAAVGDVNLVAYVTVREEAEAPDLPALRSSLARHLPEYMLPAALVVLPAMPLSPNGKADRKALAQIAPEAGAAAPAERVAPRNALERFLAHLWSDVLRTEGFGVHDSFFQLGGNSITGAIFINRLQQELGEIVHVVTIFDHPTIAGLAAFVAAEYPRAVERLFGAEALAGAGAFGFDGTKSRRVDEELIAEVSRLVHQLGPLPEEIAALPKNPSAVFVLSPPRSGSTLLRVMLAGSPALFAPPELELLGFDTMDERRDAFPGRDAFRLEGLLRAVMEARGCGPDEARALVDGFEREELSTRAMYGRLQEWIGGRTLVDKTPTYAWDREALRRAEAGFAGARYVHLVRHPLGMVKSFEEARIDQIFFHEDHSWSRREVAEALWALAQRNTLDFLAGIPAERQHTVVFEELLRDPERVLRGLSRFLGIDYHPDMASPYQKSSARMTDGLHAESRMLGDVKFHQHGKVEAAVAESWRQEYREESLGEPARALAVQLGYALPPAGSWIPIPHVEVAPGEPQALSFAQERLWFLEQLHPGQPTYNMVAAVRLSGALDAFALEQSLNEVVRRHEGLRVTFASRSGKPVQTVRPASPLFMPRVDLSGAPDPEHEARRLVLREHYRNFDLERGPLFRATLLVLGKDEHALLLSMHHIVSDGWSLGVLVREVAALYMAFTERRPSPLTPLPIQYADFARWQRDWLRGAVLQEQLGYWKERLAGASPLPLPVDRRPTSEKDFHVDGVPVALPKELTETLQELSRRRGTTLFMTLLAVFQALLARHTGQADVAVATPVAGRTRAETEGLIGFFVNTLVLRVDASGPTFGELLTRVRQVTLGAYDHQELPFATLVEALRPERHLGSYPLAEVLFALQNHPMPALELPGMSLRPLAAADEDAESQANFTLTLRFWETGGALSGGFAFNTAFFDRATIERWHGHLRTLVEAVAADPELRLAELPFLSESERFQARAAEAPPERSEEKTPAAPAVPAVAETVAQQRAELSSRRETLSASKRELLERRLRGAKAAGPAVAASVAKAPAAALSATPSILVKLQAGNGARRPFFCVHAIGGAVYSYAELARSLSPGQPFYGLQAPGLDGGAGSDGASGGVQDIEAMAREYVAAIQKVQPQGPYRLGGWSFGGVVAFEMARQLRAAGFEVELLALLDSHAPADPSNNAALEERSEADLLRFFLHDHARAQGQALEPPAGLASLPDLIAWGRASGLLKADVKIEQVQRMLGVYKTNLQALARYRPQPVPSDGGRIVLFRPEGAPAEVRAREANGWSALSAAPIEVCWVGGDHYTMLRQPEVRALAARLEACLS